MQRIYEPQDLLEAELLLGMLASEGWRRIWVGAPPARAVGELPALGLLGLLVEDEEAERARRLIAAYNAAAPLPGEEPDGLPVCCFVEFFCLLLLETPPPMSGRYALFRWPQALSSLPGFPEVVAATLEPGAGRPGAVRAPARGRAAGGGRALGADPGLAG